MKNIPKKSPIEPCNPGCSFCFLNYSDILGKNSLFSGIEPADIGRLIKKTHHKVRNYGKNEIIAYSGDEYRNLLFIVEGTVVGEIIDFEGKVVRIEELRSPDSIAGAFLFGNRNRLPVNVTALTESKILMIPRQDLLRLLKENETILRNYLNMVCNRTQHLTHKIRMLSMQSIRGKLAFHILSLLKETTVEEVVLQHTQSELAEIFGVARPSLARVLREMNDEGLIRSQRRNIKILDRSRLSSLLK